MSRTRLTKPAFWLLPGLAFSFTGCGLTQNVTDGAKSAFNSLFYRKISQLHLDFTAREALNTDARESHSLSVPVMIRIYQLKDRKIFDQLVYQQLSEEGDTTLLTDLLARRDVVVKPGGVSSVNMPMEADTRFVAVAGLFRHPDIAKNTWKRVLKREELDPAKPRVLEAGNNNLRLLPLRNE
ncbi:type VI secretion system lipoprotein TssJ [Martelella alba]|uniref:Type VI secretion system lipoprotein TssJ n=1 Tax=Martelella alba TaxID=2590451 RepID=A0ABY2SKA7_9HYPH|nr:type VI secretion system lipoprotein TssJ [Martelella alba]TKI03723.1 type VI secretion system lipoprotein TssJ [Martelella alba]